MDKRATRDETHNVAALSHWLGGVDASVAAQMVAATSDVALMLDSDGIIRDLSVGTEELVRSGIGDLVGQPWTETVAKDSRPKVLQMLADISAGQQAKPREINQNTVSGGDVPISFSVIGVGSSGQLVALGRDMRKVSVLQKRLVESQQAMEREYARMRAAETRYRMLFHLASDPILIVDTRTFRILEANPAAQRSLADGDDRLVNQSVLDLLERSSGLALKASIASAQNSGHAPDVSIHAASDGRAFRMALSTFRQDNANLLLLRLAPLDGAQTNPGSALVPLLIEQMPDGFVATDAGLMIVEVNQAFLDLAQISTRAQAIGAPLDRWLGRAGIDVPLLIDNLNAHGTARNFPTILRGEFGSVEDIELSAVHIAGQGPVSYGISLRTLGVRNAVEAARPRTLPRSVEHLTELVGRVSLKDLVRETTDVIEKLCIEAALELSKDNRASAANMLGLSRQSFYAKMRRHGLGDLDGSDPETDDALN